MIKSFLDRVILGGESDLKISLSLSTGILMICLNYIYH